MISMQKDSNPRAIRDEIDEIRATTLAKQDEGRGGEADKTTIETDCRAGVKVFDKSRCIEMRTKQASKLAFRLSFRHSGKQTSRAIAVSKYLLIFGLAEITAGIPKASIYFILIAE